MNVQDEIKALKERIAELEELAKEEQDFPQDGDGYWCIEDSTEVGRFIWDGDDFDNELLSVGNVFRTEEEAEFAVKKLKVEAELRKFSRPFEKGEYNSYIFFYIDGDYLEVGHKVSTPSQGAIYFESTTIANEATDTVGEERIKKYLFGVED